ncbi:endonuclease/exonuclease/phosphatase family protein [Aestuariibius insulae]|uniref:endonuclease/exonuclease/phosphatase family protein n=1 Tax=Aestuariibius insulae TaxID=2058287 RepID=UPI00345E34E8
MRAETAKPLRLASYNIRAGLGTDLKRDPARVLRAIHALQADLVVLQEADHRLGARPSALPLDQIEALTGLHPLPVAENGESLGWHGIAMLAKPSFPVLGVHRFDLPGLEPRGAVTVDVEAPDGPLRIVGVHLGLLRRSRRAQIDAIKEAVAALPSRPTILIGDFNEWSGKAGLGRVTRGYTLLTPEKTFPARRPLLPLDRIAHTGDLDIALLPPSEAAHPHPSDHRPILATVARKISAPGAADMKALQISPSDRPS